MRNLILTLVVSYGCSALGGEPFVIRVVDEETGRGVPLVSLRTVNSIVQWTDSAGVSVFDEPGLMGSNVFFSVDGHGYEVKADGFGNRGKRFKVEPGGTGVIRVKRMFPAERLYRLTGAGIYRDSVIAGLGAPTRQPVLNGRVFGSDSVVTALYRDKLYWFWGDTNRPEYPLGNFHVPGAVSVLPDAGGLDPDTGVDLDYFVNPKTGFAKETAWMEGEGPTWINGLTVLRDGGRERMFAAYVKVAKPMRVYEHGLVEFVDATEKFELFKRFDEGAAIYPKGHPLRHTVGGREYLYFTESYPIERVAADMESLGDPGAYESFTCLKAGTKAEDGELDRDASGRLRYAWKRATQMVSTSQQAQLIKDGKMESGEGLLQLRDVLTGQPVAIHRSSVYFNPYRGRWVLVGNEYFGQSSLLGEVWYAEADRALGPWVYARQVATHNKY
ncbi:MAG: hypothetical protein ACYTGQ_01755, partial [Planctomycetota bacterium]